MSFDIPGKAVVFLVLIAIFVSAAATFMIMEGISRPPKIEKPVAEANVKLTIVKPNETQSAGAGKGEAAIR